MKNDWSRSFYRQIAVNICYSALIACLVDAFLIMNMNFLLAYLDQTRYANLLILQIFKKRISGSSWIRNESRSGRRMS